MKFHLLESEETAGPSRITQTRKHILQGSRTTRGGGRPQNVSAADLVFYALCVLIFAGTPLVVVLS